MMKRKLERLNDEKFNQLSKEEIANVTGGSTTSWWDGGNTYVSTNTDYILNGDGDANGRQAVLDWEYQDWWE